MIRFTLLSLAFVLSGAAFGQSNLPPCPGSDVARWSNCFGSFTTSKGDKYVGEFKDGKYNGQGTYFFFVDSQLLRGEKYVGEFKNDNANGQGTFTYANGDKYVGEVKDGQRNGQGIYYYLAENGNKGDKYVGEHKNNKLNGQGTLTYSNGNTKVGEFKDGKFSGQGYVKTADGYIGLGEFEDDIPSGRFISYNPDGTIEFSGIVKGADLITSQYVDPNSFTRIAKNNKAPALHEPQRLEAERLKNQLDKERQRLAEEKQKFDAEKAQLEAKNKLSRISIQAAATTPDADGDFVIKIQTSADTASLKIDGEELGGKRDGNYVIKRVARVGEQNTYTITARDVFGNTDTKTISVARKAVDSRPTFARLNPANVKPQPARDAVAIIIGIQNYKLIPRAEYASQDAQDFYDYASRALGIKQENIKLLLDDEADVSGILTAFQNWLPLKVRKGKTDVYVFYSGHGLPSPDGKFLFFLPVGVNKDFVAKTAISQQEIVAGLKAAQPKSVTMFIDSCYSGQIRTGETLLASARPVVLTVQETAYPPDFTVITASASDQIASSSPDLKHGIFSYYLMKGLEGEADDKGDGTITVGKLQSYLAERVPRFAMTMSRKQEPQLTGDANRVLVAR